MIKQLRFTCAVGIAAGILGASGVANAQSSCDSVLSSYSFYIQANMIANAQDLLADYPQCFAGGSTTSTTAINATVFTQAGAISQALSSRFRPAGQGPIASIDGVSGLAAGGAQSWNAWASYNGNSSRVSYTNLAATTTRSDSNVDTTVLGGDYALAPNMTLGISAGFDRGNGSGQTGAAAPTTNGTNGYTIAPYIGYQLSKDLALDASAGWGEGEFSTGAVKADAKRWFATGNLSYSQWMANWQLTGKLSYLHGEEKYADSKTAGVVNAGTASKNAVDQARVGIQAGYWMNGFMPYAGLVYSSDIRRSSSTAVPVDPLGRGAFVWSVGASFFSLASKLTGGLVYEQESGRTNSKNEKLMANINMRF